MKIRLTIFMLVMLSCAAYATEYTVYSTIGDVYELRGKRKMPLAAKQTLLDDSKVGVGVESALVLLDEANAKLITIRNTPVVRVETLVNSKDATSKSLTRKYFNYLVKELFASKEMKMHPSAYMQATASAYRSESNDSLLINSISQVVNRQQTSYSSIEEAIVAPRTVITTDFDVNFQLISYTTNAPLTNDVDFDTSCYLRATNNTSKILYINLLNIDGKGNKYMVLPMDAEATCSNLIVPPMSSVSFKDEPFIFGEEKSLESFLMVATEDPLDFSILMNPIPNTGGQTIDVGLCRKFYNVK